MKGVDRSSRLALTWAAVRDSLWFVPALSTVAAIVLAGIAVQIPTPTPDSRLAWIWLYGGGAEGARGVLTTIAGSLITVTGVVFSVTIVALQLASSQFTPRVLGGFMADRVNQVVLGVFIGTFTYTLLVLRSIHSPVDEREGLVPQVGVTIALVLLLVSIAALITFINHAARSIQASVVLERETRRTLERIDVLFPQELGRGVETAKDPDVPAGRPAVVVAEKAGYLQALHAEALWRDLAGRRLTIRMELHMGAFAFPGKALASVWPAEAVDEEVERIVAGAFVLGHERTPEQDVEFGLVALSDIALKALSPGINDPTTATHCIDRLSQLLAVLGRRHHPALVRESPDGAVRLHVLDTPFERAVGVAFDQIRHFGASNPLIGKKLLEVLADLAAAVPAGDRPPLAAQARAVVRAVRHAIDDPDELASVERLAAKVVPAVEGAGAGEGPTPRPRASVD